MNRSRSKAEPAKASGSPPAIQDPAYLAMLLGHVSDGVVGTDAETRITYWGPGAQRMYGYSAAEAIGRTTLDLLRPAYNPGERERIMAEIEIHGSVLAVLRTRHKSGSEVVVEVHSTGLADERGRRTGFVVVYRDMTERYRTSLALQEANGLLRVQAEELLARERQLQAQSLELRSQADTIRLSEAELWGILNATKESIWQFSPDGIVLMGNEVALRRFGRPADEVVGRPFSEFVPPELAASRQARLREVVESGRAVEFEDVRAGISFEHSFYPVFDAGGKVSSIACFSRDVTARKQIEEALIKARAEADVRARELEIIMEAVPAGVMITRDPEGLEITGNRAARELLHIPAGEDNISKSAPDPEGRRSYRPFRNGIELPPEELPIQSAARGHEVRDWDCDIVLDDGEVRHLIINASPLQRGGEQFRGAVGAFLDVTDRVREEEARQRDRERFELLSLTAGRLLESENPQTVVDELCRKIMAHLDCQLFFNFLVDREAGKLRLNACGGLPDEEVRKLKWLDFGTAVCGYVVLNATRVVAEDIPARPDPRTNLVAGYGVRAYACHPLMSRGEVLGTLSFGTKTRTRFSGEDLSLMKTVADQVAVAIARILDEQALRERGLELQGLTEDLETRVKERTAELAAANEMLLAEAAQRVRLVAAVEQADEGIAILDAEGSFHDVNEAFVRLSGRRRDELPAVRYRDLLPRSPEGQDAWADMKISIERGETWRGHISRGDENADPLELDVAISPIHDASGRIINYLAVERDVSKEIRLQQHLRQIQKLEALGTLAGGIAHDFNNILNPIFISTELLLLEPDIDPASRRHLEVTLKAAERGRDLVKQIIAFSRQKERERKPSKAGPVVTEAVKFLRVSLPSTIEIRSDIRDESDFILGDQAQIHQIVMNLCNNAAYAMREKGGILSVGLAEVDVDERLAARVPALRTGPYLRLTVADTGTGMTAQVRERAFDPFFTTKKAGEGSGMGLAVVAGIVRDYGGAITFTSEEDRGTTFMIYLPRVACERPALKTAPDGLPGGSERILFIDDEEVQVQSVRGMLARLGYQVVAVTNGQEALDRFRADPQFFDLVITDQTMPQLTGVRIAEEVLGLRPDLPIVLCTGYSETVDAAGARALGIREFLMKPYSVREMAETVRRALSGQARPSPGQKHGG